LEILELPVDKLLFDPNNARRHDRKNLDAIKGSLAKFGQMTPIVIDDNNIILKGNGTVEALKEMGLPTVFCRRANLTTMTEKTAYALADNRSSELATWDMDVLGSELQSLREDGFQIEDIGFDPGDFEGKDFDPNSLMGGFSENDPNDRKTEDLVTCPNCGVAIEKNP